MAVDWGRVSWELAKMSGIALRHATTSIHVLNQIYIRKRTHDRVHAYKLLERGLYAETHCPSSSAAVLNGGHSV